MKRAFLGWSIIGYVGENGSGKTLSMVEDLAVPAIEKGLPVMANFRVDYERFVPLRSWRQLVEPVSPGDPHLKALNGEDGVVLLDEMSAVLPSREAMKAPPQLVRIINQLRKAGVRLGWAAPAWERCDKALREVTQAVAVCRGYVADRYVREPGVYTFPRRGPILRDGAGNLVVPRSWPPHCFFSVSYYPAADFDEFSISGVAKTVKPAHHRYYWRPAHRAHLLYDTLEGVDLLDHLDDSGACFTCGGARKRRQCTCALDSPFVGPDALPRVAPKVALPVAVGAAHGGADGGRPVGGTGDGGGVLGRGARVGADGLSERSA